MDSDTALQGARVLLVDDVPANLDLLYALLEPEGALSMAPSGDVALKIAAGTGAVPDLILLDVMMPGMDGFEVCRRLKDDDRTKAIRVVFDTGEGLTENVVTGFEAAGVDYTSKPIRDQEMLMRVRLRIRYLTRERAGGTGSWPLCAPTNQAKRSRTMRRISVLLALSLLVASAAHPCSAKFAGRQTALQARPALRPASILILSNESLRVHVRPLTSTLERLGHKVTEVESPDEILNVLSSGKKYDIVLASVADLGSLAERFDTSSAGVVAVPLIRRVSAEDVTSPEGYPIALDLAAKSTMIREMIERAMEQKEEGAKAKQSREDA